MVVSIGDTEWQSMKTGLGSLELVEHPMLTFTLLVPGPLRSISHSCFVAAENLHIFKILCVVKKPTRRGLNKRTDNLGRNSLGKSECGS